MISWRNKKYKGWTLEVFPDQPGWHYITITDPEGEILVRRKNIMANTSWGVKHQARSIIKSHLRYEKAREVPTKTYNL